MNTFPKAMLLTTTLATMAFSTAMAADYSECTPHTQSPDRGVYDACDDANKEAATNEHNRKSDVFHDYSVGIVNAGTGTLNTGTALNLYAITKKGVDLVEGSPYVFPQPSPPIYPTFAPLVAVMSPDRDFAYVVYVRVIAIPIIVQFAITPHGLEYRWQQEVSSGQPDLGAPQDSGIRTVSHYVIEYVRPYGREVHVLNESGQELVHDAGTNGANLISANIDPIGKFYYSCRYLPAPPSGNSGDNGPANAVAVYTLEKSVTEGSPPLFTSTDPAFVQSECL